MFAGKLKGRLNSGVGRSVSVGSDGDASSSAREAPLCDLVQEAEEEAKKIVEKEMLKADYKRMQV